METGKVLEDEYCAAFNRKCRHCNIAITYHEATKLIPPKHGNKLFTSGGRTMIKRILGCYCNNVDKFTDNMTECPIQYQEQNPIDLALANKRLKQAMAFKPGQKKGKLKPTPNPAKPPGQATLKF